MTSMTALMEKTKGVHHLTYVPLIRLIDVQTLVSAFLIIEYAMDDMIVRMEKTKDGMSVLSDHSFNTFPVSPTTSQIRD